MNLHRIDPNDERSLPAVTVPLVAGLVMAECVSGDGTTALWLMRDDDAGTIGCASRCCAPHERTGPLPAELRDRLGLVHRCGAPTRSTGHPCRSIVQAADDTCGTHRRREARA